MVGLVDSSGITQRERSGKRKKVKSIRSLPYDPSVTGLSYLQTVHVKKWTLAVYCLNTKAGREKYLDF